MLLSVGEGSLENTTLLFVKSFQSPMLSWKCFEKKTSCAICLREAEDKQLPLKILTLEGQLE